MIEQTFRRHFASTANLPKEAQSKCEIREGIGLCDSCRLPKWPQQYVGYGYMLCLDCLAQKNFSGGVAEMADATAQSKAARERLSTDTGSSTASDDDGCDRVAGSNPAAPSNLSPHEVLESPKTPWEYLLHLAIAAKARGIAFQLDSTRFYVLCSDASWAFLKGDVMEAME